MTPVTAAGMRTFSPWTHHQRRKHQPRAARPGRVHRFASRPAPRLRCRSQEIAARDSAQSAHRIARTRVPRPRRACSPMRLEVLEERTLLSLTLIKDINPLPFFPAEITGAGGNVYFVTKAAGGAAD